MPAAVFRLGAMPTTLFRRVALTAWLMQALIVVSGAAVRLTEAGLGCEDWPTCNEDRVLPEWQLHGLIEFGNRLISGLVALSAIAVVVAAYRRRPRRGDLIGLAWAVLGGTMLQVVLGGVTVLLDLNPIVVSVHFLISMGLLLAAQVLWFRADPGREGSARMTHPGPTGSVSPLNQQPLDQQPLDRQPLDRLPLDRLLLRGQVVLATAVLLSGTVVTGSGPNSGDSRAERLGFDLASVARIHSGFVWMLIATLVVVAARSARLRSPQPPGSTSQAELKALRVLLTVAVAQGAIGYAQFALGVPALLVELHILGAVAVWSLSIQLYLEGDHGRRRPAPHAPGRREPSPRPDPPRESDRVAQRRG